MTTIRNAARGIVLRDGLLLVVRYRDEHGEFFVTPGGGQQHGEPLPAVVVREVAEETGYQVRPGELRFVREFIAGPNSRALPPGFHEIEFFFTCELLAEVPGAALELDPNQDGALWLSLAELRQRVFFPPRLLDYLEEGRDFGFLETE